MGYIGRKALAAALVVGAASTLAGRAEAQQPPSPGSYFVASVTTATEGRCADSPGTGASGVADYQGVNGGTFTIRALGATGIVRTTYTIASGLGTTSPSGTFASSTPGAAPVSGAFSATLAFFDKQSFSASVVLQTGLCTESANVYLLRIGKL